MQRPSASTIPVAATSRAGHAVRALLGLPRMLGLLALLGWVLGRFAWRARGHYLRTARRGFALAARLRREPVAASPLAQHAEHVHRVDPGWLGARVAAASPAPPAAPLRGGVVIHLSATGETRHGPIASLAQLLQYMPELAALPHYVIDAPHEAAPYRSARAFGLWLWTKAAPLVDAHEGPCFFVGLSRGAIAALQLGARAAAEKHRVTSVLACSPPFARPPRLPPSIELIAALLPLVEHAAAMLEHAPWVAQLHERISAPVQTLLTSFVLAELGLHDDDNLLWALRDVVHDPILPTSLRSVREFALLTRVRERELHALMDAVAAGVANLPLLSLAIVSGKDDPWTPAERNAELFAEALQRHGVLPARDRSARFVLLEGAGHAFCRHREPPLAALRAVGEQLLAWTHEKAAVAKPR